MTKRTQQNKDNCKEDTDEYGDYEDEDNIEEMTVDDWRW